MILQYLPTLHKDTVVIGIYLSKTSLKSLYLNIISQTNVANYRRQPTAEYLKQQALRCFSWTIHVPNLAWCQKYNNIGLNNNF